MREWRTDKLEMDVEASRYATASHPGRGYRSKLAPYGDQLGFRRDGRCHIDGHPCDRSARCNEVPFLVCGNCRVTRNVSYGWNVCARCERMGDCQGFKCLLRPDREGGKTIIGTDLTQKRERQ